MELTRYKSIIEELKPYQCQLIAASKTKPVGDIRQLYDAGQRLFGENKVQELVEKYEALPQDIDWHLIGHLQTNKVKYIAPFVAMIQSVDSMKLLIEINKQGEKCQRKINCLLQIFIASEETKFGLDRIELDGIVAGYQQGDFPYVHFCGMMGMASNTDNLLQIESEMSGLQQLFLKYQIVFNSGSQNLFAELSMGMSSDYRIALKYGATLVRIGSSLFGAR